MKKIFLNILLISFLFLSCSKTDKSKGLDDKNNNKTENDAINNESNEDDENSDKTDSSKPVTLNIFQFKVEFVKQFEAFAKVYMKSHPNVTLKIQTVGGGDDYGTALKARFASGNEPTIFNIGGPQDIVDWKDTLLDLTDEGWQDLAFKGTLDPVTDNGKLFGIPFSQEGYGFIYNKTIFKKAGIDPKIIVSFDSLKEAVEKLDSQKKDLGLDAVFALPGKETWVTGLHMANTALSQEFKNVMNATNAKEVEFTYSQGLHDLIELQKKYGYNSENINAVDYSTQVEETFSLGKVAIIQQGNWVLNSISDIDPELAKNVGFLPEPIKGGIEDSIYVGVPMYWSINRNSSPEEIKAAKEFLKYMYTSDEGKDFVVNKFKFIPAIKGYEDFTSFDPLSADILDYSKRAKTLPWVFMGFPTNWGMGVLGSDIQKYFAGEFTWERVIEDSKSQWKAMREQK